MHTKRPPRLKGFDYRGFHRYFLTICTNARRRWFADIAAGRGLVDHFLQSASAHRFDVTAYCLMPDHLHALVHATSVDADFAQFVRVWKQKTSFEWKRRTGAVLWQEGYYERVLRDEEGDLWVISYIASNPVHAGLCESPEQYPLFGSSQYSIAEILEALKELEPWK
jgi:REP element-mobilizing transposase RayT